MKVIAILLFSVLTATAFPLVARETVAIIKTPISEAILGINKIALDLSNDINDWDGDIGKTPEIFHGAVNLVTITDAGTVQADVSEPISPAAFKYIATSPLPQWIEDFTYLFQNISAAQFKWNAIQQTSLVYGQLVAVEWSTNYFLDAVVNKVPDTSAQVLETAVKPVKNLIKKVINDFRPESEDVETTTRSPAELSNR